MGGMTKPYPPIILTADLDRRGYEGEVIPAGTVGLPVLFGSPEQRGGPTLPGPNNYYFPTLRGTPPWDFVVPLYDFDGVKQDAKYDVLDPDDPRVAEARAAADEP